MISFPCSFRSPAASGLMFKIKSSRADRMTVQAPWPAVPQGEVGLCRLNSMPGGRGQPRQMRCPFFLFPVAAGLF